MKSLLVMAVVGFAAAPCLWDSDTLDTELRGLPGSLDLIVGRCHKHSDAYYENRVTKLTAKPALTLADFDDLAVAYEHLNQRDLAIEVMARKAQALARTPDEEHQYRYHANLGTFYAHAGNFDDALTQLRTAVAIQPDAHFGREAYQIELIEYLAAATEDPEIWRRRSFLRHAGYALPIHLAGQGLELDEYRGAEDWQRDWNGSRQLDWEEAHTAIGGMLRFGGLEGPELYRSLGELYLQGRHLNLAWWAFGRAIERGHPAVDVLQAGQESIVEHWARAREHTKTDHVWPTQADYVKRRADADRWLAAFQDAETAMVQAGEDVNSDEALQSLIDRADRAVPQAPTAASPAPPMGPISIFIGALAIMLVWIIWARASRT